MTREQWLGKLEKELQKLPQEEREDAMGYYQEYFYEGGEEREAEILKDLGNPSKVASQIKSDFAIKRLDSEEYERQEGKKQKTTTKIWLIILAVIGGIAAAPFALPIAIVLIGIVITGIALVFAFLVTVVGILISFVAMGVILIVGGIGIILTNWAAGLLSVGIGLMVLGLSAAATVGTIIGIKTFVGFIARKLREKKAKKKLLEEKKEEGHE